MGRNGPKPQNQQPAAPLADPYFSKASAQKYITTTTNSVPAPIPSPGVVLGAEDVRSMAQAFGATNSPALELAVMEQHRSGMQTTSNTFSRLRDSIANRFGTPKTERGTVPPGRPPVPSPAAPPNWPSGRRERPLGVRPPPPAAPPEPSRSTVPAVVPIKDAAPSSGRVKRNVQL